MANKLDPRLKEWGTQIQNNCLDAVNEHGNYTKAAKALGVCTTSVNKNIHALLKKAMLAGYREINETNETNETVLNHDKWLIIPDCQVRPDIDMAYLHCIGEYALAKKPSKLICLGDWADMPSLSSYDKGKRSYEGQRYKNDIESSITGMSIFLEPIKKHNRLMKKTGGELYEPDMIMLLGNHEDRINRATQLEPMLYGTISIEDLKYKEFGWEVHNFKKVVVIDGIAFSHYFTTGKMGNPCGTAQQQYNKMHMSCISGHQQGRQTVTGKRADGKQMTSIIAGSAYDFYMDYLGEQDNCHWRGVIMLHNVNDGEFDEVYVPIDYLKRRYNPSGRKFLFSES